MTSVMSCFARLPTALLLVTLLVTGNPDAMSAEPAKLAATPIPTATVQNSSPQQVQDALVAINLMLGRTPVRQDPNVLVYEFPLSFGQSLAVQMLQGNSGWQEPKGRCTFAMAKMGTGVVVTGKFETIATNMFNAANAIEINNGVSYNELHLTLQLARKIAEGKIDLSNLPKMGIMMEQKPSKRIMKTGFPIDSVVPGSPAAEAGIVAGDVITAIDGMATAKQSIWSVQLMLVLGETYSDLQLQKAGLVRVAKRPNATTMSSTPTGPAALPAAAQNSAVP